MANKKHDLPAMPFYIGDWKKDPAVQVLTREQKMIWLEMIMLMWESEERGFLTINCKPMTNEMLGTALNLDNQSLTSCLTYFSDLNLFSKREKDGAIYSRKIINILELSKKRKKAGSLGGNPNLLNQEVNQKATKRLTSVTKFGYPNAEDETETETETASKTKTKTDIEIKDEREEFRGEREGIKKVDKKSSAAIKLTQLLFDLIKERKIDFKTPNLDKWSREMDKTIKIDHRSPETIEAVIRWCQADDFWQDNILSAKKLRKQFDQLEMKARKDSLPKHTRENIATYQRMAAKYGWKEEE